MLFLKLIEYNLQINLRNYATLKMVSITRKKTQLLWKFCSKQKNQCWSLQKNNFSIILSFFFHFELIHNILLNNTHYTLIILMIKFNYGINYINFQNHIPPPYFPAVRMCIFIHSISNTPFEMRLVNVRLDKSYCL